MKITKEILEQGRRNDGTYSDSQLRIFGFTEDSCDRWQEQILGDEEPLWKIKIFQGMKDWVFIDKREKPAKKFSFEINENTRTMFSLGKSRKGGYNKWQMKVLI